MSYQALLFCPDDKTARVVTQVLTELDFTVEPCNEPFAAVKKLMAQHYDALVVDCDNEQNATLLFKSARNSGSNQTSLAVAVVEGQTGVAKAFRIGANLVLTKPINVEQSKGTLRVARGLLRKADSTKPAGTTAPSIPAARPAQTSFDSPRLTPTPRPAEISIPTPHTPTLAAPTVPTSGFELEREADTKLEPTEAAMLESMPNTVPTTFEVPAQPVRKPAATTPAPSKEYPWQPVSKPLSEPMASALRRAAEAPGKSTPEPVAATETSNANDGLITPTPRPTPKENWPTAATVPSGLGTANQSAVSQRTQSHSGAAAAAPAREVFPSKIQTIQPEPPEVGTPAPTRAKEREKNKEVESKPTRLIVDDSTVTSLNISETSSTEEFDQQDESDSGGSKRTPLIAVAVILLAVAGYFGWAKMHSGDAPPAVQQQTSPAQTEPAPQAVVSGTPVTSATATLGTSPHSSTETATPANGKPSPAKSPSGSSSTILDVTPVEAEKGPEAIVVKTAPTQSATPKPATQEPEQAPAPESLGVTSTASQKAISGIASATPINVPKQTPQTMKVSQGVLQGMLVKKVQPLYPPQAQQRRIQGSVVMQATIGKDGSITNVKVLSGDSQLAQAATDAVRQWKYKPYVLNGEPVEIQSQVTVNFKLP